MLLLNSYYTGGETHTHTHTKKKGMKATKTDFLAKRINLNSDFTVSFTAWRITAVFLML